MQSPCCGAALVDINAKQKECPKCRKLWSKYMLKKAAKHAEPLKSPISEGRS